MTVVPGWPGSRPAVRGPAGPRRIGDSNRSIGFQQGTGKYTVPPESNIISGEKVILCWMDGEGGVAVVEYLVGRRYIHVMLCPGTETFGHALVKSEITSLVMLIRGSIMTFKAFASPEMHFIHCELLNGMVLD